MEIFLYVMIAILGLSSYIVGLLQMLKNEYSPSTFSRVVWVLLAINSFAGVLMSGGGKSSVLLGAVMLIGNITICIASFWKGTKSIGKLEYFCIALLVVSVLIWIFFNAPLVNLAVSLIAHFIGAAPTYKKVWQNPRSESIGFWSLFFLASVLSIFVSPSYSLSAVLLPVYFTFFDGSIFVLALRQFLPSKNKNNTESQLQTK